MSVRLMAVDPRARKTRAGMLENRVVNPGGDNSAAGWSANTPVATVESGPALGDMATSARLTRAQAGAVRISVNAPFLASQTYTVRVHLRASEALSGGSLLLRPNNTTSTGQAVFGNISIPAGESEWVRTITATSTAPVSSAGVSITLASGSGAIGATLDVTACLVRGETDPGVIFDGTWDWARWLGSPYASNSLGYAELMRP